MFAPSYHFVTVHTVMLVLSLLGFILLLTVVETYARSEVDHSVEDPSSLEDQPSGDAPTNPNKAV